MAAERVAAAAQQTKAPPVTPAAQRKRRRSYTGEGELHGESDAEFEREGTPEGWSEALPGASTFPLAPSRGQGTSLVLAMRTAHIVRE